MPQTESVTLLAHAKVNLMLAVTGRRADGYHTIDTVMQSISLANRLTVTAAAEGITLTCSDPAVPTDRRNTAMRAAEGFFTAAGITGGALIAIEKLVPYEAGLGSASADAAGTLAALNRLYGGVLSDEKMHAVALSVGADVPFCLAGGTMRAAGIGEVLTPLSPLGNCFFVIAKGSRGVSTPQAYRALDAAPAQSQPDADEMCRALARGDIAGIAACCRNVFTACCADEETEAIRRAMLGCGAAAASMSGSGSAIFGLFDSEKKAASAAKALAAPSRFVTAAAPVQSGVTFI